MRLVDADTLIPKEVHTIIRLTATGEQTESVVYAEQIDNAPTVDAVERKRGQWIDLGKDRAIRWQCPECGRKDTHIYNYCPDCGVNMRTKETDFDYQIAIEQLEHDMLYEPAYNPDDGSMRGENNG